MAIPKSVRTAGFVAGVAAVFAVSIAIQFVGFAALPLWAQIAVVAILLPSAVWLIVSYLRERGRERARTGDASGPRPEGRRARAQYPVREFIWHYGLAIAVVLCCGLVVIVALARG